ncbi:hypothetical protein JCM11641_000778 [Rhodosporidiobolus odoratus]
MGLTASPYPERFAPTLSSLPAKLKQRISDHLDDISLYDDVEDVSSGGEEHKHEGGKACGCGTKIGQSDDEVSEILDDPEEQRMATLSALSRVNKEWYALVAPVFWEELWLYPCSTEALLNLVTSELPRQGQNVEHLLFRESPFDLLTEDAPTDTLPPAEGRALEVVEATERFVNADACLAWELRALRARNILLAEVIKTCPNVESLDIEGSVRPLKVESGDDEEKPLTIPESDIPNLAMQAINSFVVTEDEQAEKANRDKLFLAWSFLQHLEELDLSESTFVTDELAVVPFSFPLNRLVLGESLELSFPSFVTLDERFSATLEYLGIDGTPHDEDEAATAANIGKPLDLPKLSALELSTPHKPAFLNAFAKCPIKESALGLSPQFTVEDVLAFLESHKETLIYVTMEPGAVPSEEKEGEKFKSSLEVIV